MLVHAEVVRDLVPHRIADHLLILTLVSAACLNPKTTDSEILKPFAKPCVVFPAHRLFLGFARDQCRKYAYHQGA